MFKLAIREAGHTANVYQKILSSDETRIKLHANYYVLSKTYIANEHKHMITRVKRGADNATPTRMKILFFIRDRVAGLG